MNWPNIVTVYLKELRDMLRDRRTIISMIVVPTLVMPGLMALVVFTMYKIARQVAAETPSIMLIGGNDSPLLRDALLANQKVKVVPLADDWKRRISEKRLGAAVEIPAGFDASLDRGDMPTVKIDTYETEVRSERAAREVSSFLAQYGERIVTARLAARGLSPTAIKPFITRTENVAPPEKVGGNFVGGIIPYFFLLLSFTGAMYPALDLTAGEKERGTMETLLCSPVPRIDLVVGKFLTILTVSLATVACSLTSMAVTLTVGGGILAQKLAGGGAAGAQRAAQKFSAMATLDPVGVIAVVGLVIPMAVLFAAGLFTIALFAKSFKEAQSYVSPLIIVIIMPAVVGMLPGVELNARLALVPILNVSLASKELVSGVWHWNYLALIFSSTCVYAAIALALAVKMFNREDVIFRA
jgi:sodium transport system permease protein